MRSKRILTTKLLHLSHIRGKRASGEPAVGGPDSLQPLKELSDVPEFRNISSIVINPGQDNHSHAVISGLGKKITALLDSGANCSLLGGRNVNLVEKLSLRKGVVEGGIKTADGTRHRIDSFTRLLQQPKRDDTGTVGAHHSGLRNTWH